MSRRPALTGSVLALLLAALAACSEPEGGRSDGPGDDAAAAVERADPEELPALAEGFLATERPWSAARAMRRYLERVDDPPLDRRLLAARAEAGWGAWERVAELLEGARGLDALDGGVGLWLLARAREEAGDPAGAAEAYDAFLALSPPEGELEEERGAARLRRSLLALRAGDGTGGAEGALAAAPGADRWLPLLRADALARAGDTAGVRRAVAPFDDGLAGLRAWRARVEAALRAGDPAAARALANRARGWARTDGTRAEFMVAAGRAAELMGDARAGRDAFRAAVDLDPGGPHARAAAALLREGDMSPADHLAVARVLREQGLHEEAVEGFERWLEAAGGSARERAAVRLEYAEALFYAERFGDVEAALRPLGADPDARFLLGRALERVDVDRAVDVYLRLADELSGSSRGGRALLLAGVARHDAGEVDAARQLFRRVVARYDGSDAMGLATMRLAGIAFMAEDWAEAARLWDGYRRRFPRGDRAVQAAYWAGRAYQAAGEEAEAAERFAAVLGADRDSYYGLLASRRLDRPFWPLPGGAAPTTDADAARRVEARLEGVDLLQAAGFHDLAEEEAERIAAAAGRDRATLYALGEALVERGYGAAAIRLGLRLQSGDSPNPRLLRLLYPFPHRELVSGEARDRGFDPFVAAALIRRESLFDTRATSHVGARGLMQIMPATGRELAEEAGIEGWSDELLYHPEVNVHLGTRYLASFFEAYDGALPPVFAAYNAGPHRVERWRDYPEYEDEPELFVERIPFGETREYVKILTRNRAIYEGLYGGG